MCKRGQFGQTSRSYTSQFDLNRSYMEPSCARGAGEIVSTVKWLGIIGNSTSMLSHGFECNCWPKGNILVPSEARASIWGGGEAMSTNVNLMRSPRALRRRWNFSHKFYWDSVRVTSGLPRWIVKELHQHSQGPSINARFLVVVVKQREIPHRSQALWATMSLDYRTQ